MVALVALIIGVIVYNKVLHPEQTAPVGPAAGPPRAMSVKGFVVESQDLQNGLMAAGTLLANEEVELHPEVSGKIVQMNFTEGASVSKGALLVKLYDADLQAQLKKFLVQKETAEKTESRLKQLLAINGVGQQEYENALIQFNNIKADIEIVQTQISKTEIRAPFNGVIGLKQVSEGAFITPATTIAALQQIDPLKIDFSVPEKYFSAIRKGDLVNFTVDGTEERFSGRVFALEPKIDESTRSIKARALVQNNKGKLFPGSFAKVDLGLKGIEGALMVPTQCIIPEARNKKVVVVKNGRANFVVVETGVRNESYIQITEGISIGDTIVTTALMSLKPEIEVKISSIQQ